MQVRRIEEAQEYEAPSHFGTTALRLQGWELTDSRAFWVGLSHFLPGGGVEREAGELEKIYVVLEGAVTIVTDDGEATLRRLDSCYIAPGEARAIENRTKLPASMLTVLPYPPDHDRGRTP